MDYHKVTKQLRTNDHSIIKTLHCPYKRKELNLYYKNTRTLSCDTCQHQLLIAHEHSEQELQQAIVQNSDTCLIVDTRHIRTVSPKKG